MEFKKYFIVGTNDNALHDTMNGNVTGELIRCKDCKYWPYKEVEYYSDQACQKTYQRCFGMYGMDYCSKAERERDSE